MTDTLYRSPNITAGWLERAGQVWKLPLRSELWWVTPVDELFIGDTLHFPALDLSPGRSLLLPVTFSAGRVFTGERCHVAYELVASVSCRECGTGAVHPVTVADLGRHIAGGPVWTFSRRCSACDSDWTQDGQRPYALLENENIERK